MTTYSVVISVEDLVGHPTNTLYSLSEGNWGAETPYFCGTRVHAGVVVPEGTPTVPNILELYDSSGARIPATPVLVRHVIEEGGACRVDLVAYDVDVAGPPVTLVHRLSTAPSGVSNSQPHGTFHGDPAIVTTLTAWSGSCADAGR